MNNTVFAGWEGLESIKKGNKASFLSLKAGESAVVRFVDQAPVGSWQHWIPSVKRSVICQGADCPICAYLKGLSKDEKKNAKANNTRKFAMQLIDRTDNTLKIFENGITAFTQLKELMAEMGDLRNFDIKIKRTSDGYIFFPQAPKPLTEEDGKLYEQKQPLDEYYENKRNSISREQAQMLLDGVPPEIVFAAKKEEGTPEDAGIVFDESSSIL